MAKSLKQQLNEQLATQHVQQALNNIGLEQFQAAYDDWNKQQEGLANFEAQFNAWNEANPVQSPEPVKEAPVEAPVKVQKEIPTLQKSGLTQEQNLAFRKEKREKALQRIASKREKEEKTNNAATNETLNRLDTMTQIDLAKTPSMEDKSAKWLDPSYKLTEDDKKNAAEYARAELDKFNYGSNHQPLLKTDEERQHYADMVNLLNKTNPVTNAMTGVIKQPLNLARAVRDVGRSVGNQLTGLGAALGDKLGITEGATQRHNEKVEAADNFFNQNDESMQRAYEGAKTQNPVATTVGEVGGQIGMYALTNPLFNSLGAAAGLGKAGSFALNQVGQNAQDLALDTLPTLNQYARDGELTDEERKALLSGMGWNAAGNLIMGGAGAGIDALRNSRAARNAADAAFRTNVSEGAEKLARLADTGYEPPIGRLTAQELESLNANPVDANNSQFKTLMDQFNGQFKDESAMRNIFSPEDLDASQNTQLKALMEENLIPERLNPVTEMEGLEDSLKATELPDEIKAMNDEMGDMWSSPEAKAPEVEAPVSAEAPTAKSLDLPEETKNIINDDFVQMNYLLNPDYDVVARLNNEKVTQQFGRLTDALNDYENAVYRAENIEDVTTAKKAVNAARKSLERAVKAVDPNVKLESTKYGFGQLVGKPEFRRTQLLDPGKSTADDIIQDWVDYDVNRPNRWVKDAEPLEGYAPKASNQNVPGAEPLQFFANGPGNAEWKTSKARTNTIEKLGWGDQMPKEDFAYRVYSEAEQNADAVERYKNSKNVVADILNKNMEDYDELDVKTAYNEAQRLLDKGDRQSIAQAQMLMSKNAAAQRQSGRVVQASAEFTRNTAAGALGDAIKMEEDTIVNPWKTTHKKAAEGNSRIAKALSDMGHKADAKVKPQLTHDQIKDGVLAELNKEVGSVEKYFNENDIEYLTQLAEDKSIPVWQITSEIEHKLKTGNWYSLDESLPVPQPTNKKLQNALNSLIETEVRQTEKAAPTLQQITEEVRNTLAKEFAESDETLRLFGDDDIEYLAHLIDNGATKQELANALDHKLATGTFGISSNTIQQVNNIFKEISRFDPNSKQFVEGQAEAYRLLANEVVGDATPLEKFEAWRYLAMLGNPKTMLRNLIGNKTFGVVTGVSNNLAALAEAGIDKGVKALGGEGIQRTKSILNPVKDADLIKASLDDADISRYRQMIGSKYEKMNADTLRRSKSVFNSKLLQFYEKVTDAGISDYKAVKNKFSTSLAGYLKANGYDTSIFKAEDELARLKNLGETRLLTNAEKANIEKLTKDVEALEKARDFALKQAEYATFHEDNAVATALTRASTYLRTSDNKVLNGLGAMFEGVVPFKKTPMNVLKSGLEYSPLGAIDSIKKTGKLIYENTGKRAGNLADTYINKKGKEVAKTLASDVIDSWAKTLTGSGLTALGFYLYDKGILNSSDKDLKYQDQLEGKQNYSLTINGKTYTIDWAAPTAMPLLLGAEVAKVWRDSGNDVENWYDHLDEYLNAANRLADPLIETSMLQGVKDTLDTAANAAKYDENLNIPTLIGYNTLTGYLTQGIPTISGQIARTVDNTRRSTYTDKEGVAGTLEKQGRKLMNKIPGLSTLNQPYIDTYGREQANSPFGNPIANLGYQMASPGYLADINETPADTMSRDVYEKSGKADNILPKWNSYFKDSEGKRVSPEDYTQASRVAGEVQDEVRNALANDDWFNGLSNADQTDIVNDINTIAANMGKSSIDPKFENSNKSYLAYKEGGLKGLMDHFKNRYASNEAKKSGLNSSTKAAQAIKEDVLNGDTEAAQQKIDAATSLQDLGLTKPGPSATYYNAQSLIPGLTTEDFAKTYKAIDSDGNQGIKQDEVIAYLNKHNITSESEAQKIWSAYGSSSWKSIPKLENGTWKKKKK